MVDIKFNYLIKNKKEEFIMSFCGNCGSEVGEGVKFCPGCGAGMDGQSSFSGQNSNSVNQSSFSSSVGNLNNTTDSTANFTQEDIAQNKVMAVLAYIIFLIPLLAAKESPFARYHTNQGLILFLAGIAVMVVGVIPIIGWLIALLAPLFITVLAVIGIVNAAGGKAKELPLIGKFQLLK